MLEISSFAKRHERNVYGFFSQLKSFEEPSSKPIINFRTGDPSGAKYDCNSIQSSGVRQNLLNDDSYFLSGSDGNDSYDCLIKKKLVEFHTSPNYKPKPSDIFLFNGGDQCIFNAIKSICKPGDSVLIPKPTYWYFDLVTDVYKIQPKFYETCFEKNWEVNFENLESQIDSTTKILIYVNPGNPNCISYPKEVIQKF